MAPAERIRVEVAYCPRPGVTDLVALELPQPASVADALAASGLLERHGLALEGLRVGIWSRVAALDARLRERDRVEVYRPLAVDPKEARRQRYRRQRAAKAAA
jgi:putative ubiquitin-RnfH superfamily antitoxin RatB of RatAB toxin-antitoxin module